MCCSILTGQNSESRLGSQVTHAQKMHVFFSPPVGDGTKKNWLVLCFNNSQVFMTVSINESKPFPHSVGQDLEESFCIVFVISILDSCYMTFLFGSVISKDILKWDKEGKE